MHVQWNNCFLCLNDLEAVRGGKERKKKVTPNNVKVLLRYLLQTGSQSCDDQLLQSILQTFLESDSESDGDRKQKTKTSAPLAMFMLCDECEDSTRKILELQMELEVIQMKMIDLVKAVKETVISKSKHCGKDEMTKMSLQAFEKWLETQETLGVTFPRERKLLDMLYTFQSAVFESAKETVHIPCVYLERQTNSKFNPHFWPSSNICKTEPLEVFDDDFLEDSTSMLELEFDEPYHEETSHGFLSSPWKNTEHSNNDTGAAPHSAIVVQNDQDKSNASFTNTIKLRNTKSKTKQRKTKSRTTLRKQNEEVELSRTLSLSGQDSIIKEEISVDPNNLDFTSITDNVGGTRKPRSAAATAIQRMMDVKQLSKASFQYQPRKVRKAHRRKKEHKTITTPASKSHPNKILLNPVLKTGKVVTKRNSASQRKKSKRPKAEKRIKRSFTCEVCSYNTVYTFQFEHHLSEHETGNVNHTCPHCPHIHFSEKQFFDYHLNSHDGHNKIACDICTKLMDPITILQHIRGHVDYVFQCSCCSYCCGTREGYLKHTRYHGTAGLICDVCSKQFRHRQKLLAHLHDEHQVLEKLKCDVENCDKEYFEVVRLDAHKKLHTEAFVCFECNIQFPSLRRLQDHEIQKHSREKPCPCAECSEAFIDKPSLLRHMIRAHGAAKLKCPYCPKEYSSQGMLASHINLHEGNAYPCENCSKVFGDRKQLRRHQATHSTTKDFICEECGKAFGTAAALKHHIRIHIGDKKHKCNYCPKAFVDRKNLICHERIHTGEKPYVCETCGKDFNQRSALNQHKKIHHKELIANKCGKIDPG